MRVEIRGGLIILAAEEAQEQEAMARLEGKAADHVFLLKISSDRGCSLHDLGPRETACREPINIVFSTVEEQWRPISNLAESPFALGGRQYASVEGFWQGLKHRSAKERERIAALHGFAARRAGSDAPEAATFVYEGETLSFGGPEHWGLMRQACFAKFTQNEVARTALLSTGMRPLTHRVRRDSRTIPGVIMADIWMQTRARLQKDLQIDASRRKAEWFAQTFDGEDDASDT
jgi:predicted NAD-dependent protein-ADP-ribosyltransferase YbiA (DUF1768 family)